MFLDVPGSDVDREHCQVRWEGHQVMLHPLSEKCFVNHRRVSEPVELCQGETKQKQLVSEKGIVS